MPPGPLLVACSGGADSLALLYAAVEVGAWSLEAAVVDHGLGPHGEAACLAVEAHGRRLGVGVHRLVVVLGAGEGPEDRARRARLSALAALAIRRSCPLIALAHTREDQLETFLMRLAAGAGVKGLAAMTAARGPFRRPWLGVARADVRTWLHSQDIEIIEDPTNSDPRFLRNRVRHTLLPTMDGVFGPGWRSAALGSLEHARAADDLIEKLADAAATEEVEGLRALHPVVRQRVLASKLPPTSRRHRSALATIEAVLARPPGAVQVDLPADQVAERWRGRLRIRARAVVAPPPEPTRIAGPGRHFWGDFELMVEASASALLPGEIRIDAAAAAFPWSVRAPVAGDRVRLLGAPGSKRLSRVFIDAHHPREARQGPVVCDAQGIIWVHGLRVVERVRAGAGPSWTLRVTKRYESSASFDASHR